MKKQKKLQIKKIKKVKTGPFVKFHGYFTLVLLAAYVGLGVLGGFDVLKNDIKEKYVKAATSISVYVIGVPEVPDLQVASACDAQGAQIAQLSWSNSVVTNFFDVYKDGQLLVGGIHAVSFADTLVDVDSTYVYRIRAFNNEGSSQSQDVSIKIASCNQPPIAPAPTCAIVSFDNKDAIFSNNLKTSNPSPKITGTTNIVNANLQVGIFPGPIISASTHANSNGYWEYIVPAKLPIGNYFFQITATDPLDQSIIKTITRFFEIVVTPIYEEKPDPIHKDHEHKNSDGSVAVPTNGSNQPKPIIDNVNETDNVSEKPVIAKDIPLELYVTIANKDSLVFKSQDLDLKIVFKGASDVKLPNSLLVRYEILDEKSNVIFIQETQERIIKGQLQKKIHVPENLATGKNRIRVLVQLDGNVISGDAFFTFAEMPIITLGGGVTMTYAQLVDKMGWAVILAILLFLLFLMILSLEKYYYDRMVFEITEENLRKSGMIPRRKGVGS